MKKAIILIISLLLVFSAIETKAETNLVSIPLHNKAGNLKYKGTSTEVKMVETYVQKNDEFRGVWVSTVSNIDIPKHQSQIQYKQYLTEILNNMELWGLNAMIFQVRPMNDALYYSEYNSLSEYFTKYDPGWDMLDWLITECHKRNIEFHAWFNPYRVNNSPSKSLEDVAREYKETNAASNVSNLLKTKSGALLNPGIPEVRQFIINSIMEVAKNYDIDAVHFDDYFYRPFDDDNNYLNDMDIATYKKYNNNTTPSNNTAMANWRRAQVNLLIKGVSESLATHNTENNKAVQFGISPTGIYKNGNSGKTIDNPSYDVKLGSNTSGQEHYESYLFADSLHWIKEGYLDYILPQTYWGFEESAAGYADVVSYWTKAIQINSKVKLYVAHGSYMEIDRPAWTGHLNELEYQFRFANQFDNIRGHSFFSYKTLKNATASYYPVTYAGIQKMKTEYFKTDSIGVEQVAFSSLTIPKTACISYKIEDSKYKLNFYSESEDIKGYAIYRTAPNTVVDIKTNLYLLTNSNEAILEDFLMYDYYIVTVNRANFTSYLKKVPKTDANVSEMVSDVIKKLPTVEQYTEKDAYLLGVAANGYNNLTDAQKQLISKVHNDKLTELMDKFLTSNSEKIMNKINSIGIVTLDKETKINEIRDLYNLLSDKDKALVTNYSILEQALNRIEELKSGGTTSGTVPPVTDGTTSGTVPPVTDGTTSGTVSPGTDETTTAKPETSSCVKKESFNFKDVVFSLVMGSVFLTSLVVLIKRK